MNIHQILSRLSYSVLFRILSPRARFSLIHRFNLLGSTESISGPGSELRNTIGIREALPSLLKSYQIKSILDIPCGDFNWMKNVDLSDILYTGADIIPSLIAKNKAKHHSNNISFLELDILVDSLPKADLVIVRDLFIHFSHTNTAKALASVYKSGSSYLLATTYPSTQENLLIRDGFNYNINLQISPFNLPRPLLIIKEDGANGSSLPSLGR